MTSAAPAACENTWYTLAAPGLAATSWTSGTLTKKKSYWSEVVAVVGSHWLGATSSSTGPRVISATGSWPPQLAAAASRPA